ncbi:MBL fold metallo-hydrolase, partial [bacterium]|nr:MBL fold metallo-hydrolase [bacterium]
RKDMEKRFEKNTLLLVLSHAHVDHFFGMGAFKDVPVYMAHEGRRYFEYQLSIDFNAQVEAYSRIFPCFADAVKTADLFMPTKFFEGDLVLGHGRSIAVVRCTGGHSVGSSYVYVESEECIVAGDNVQVDYYPYFGDRSGNMNSWISALVAWELLEVKHICPGHGPTVDKEYMTTTRHFFQNLVSALKKLKIENTDIKQVIAHASLPKGYWPDELEKPLWYDPAVAQLYRSME